MPSQPATHTPTPGPSRLGTRNIPGVGKVLTDSRGLTLYTHTGGPSTKTTHCVGTCLNVWHPIVVDYPALAPTVPGTDVKVSVLPRPGGMHQLAVNGVRAYTFVDDHRPGEARGIGLYTASEPGGKVVTWRVVPVPAGAPTSIPLHR